MISSAWALTSCSDSSPLAPVLDPVQDLLLLQHPEYSEGMRRRFLFYKLNVYLVLSVPGIQSHTLFYSGVEISRYNSNSELLQLCFLGTQP